MNEQINQLKTLLRQCDVYEQSVALLMWDQVTNMPRGGVQARAEQIGALKRKSKESFTSPEIGRLLDDLRSCEESTAPDEDNAALIRVTRRNYEHELKLPPEFWGRYEEASAAAFSAWQHARQEREFDTFAPHLQKKVELCREMAGYYDGYEHLADHILAQHEYGMSAKRILQLLDELLEGLMPLVEAARSVEPRSNDCLFGHFNPDDQLQFAQRIITDFGYDWNRGRIDRTQPRMIKVSHDDVRLLVRIDDDFLDPGLFCTTHEAGHGLYELGIHPAYAGTPLGRGVSAGMHECSSLLWEAQVARSLSFWKHYYPRLQETFPDELKDVSLDTFYRAINRIHPTLIRTDADEVTYNLHLIIRYEIELNLLEGNVQVNELPSLWNAKYDQYLGVHAEDIRQGVLQDPHWSAAPIGGIFQSYALGRMYSAVLMEQVRVAYPQIDADMERGNFEILHTWLIENVYQHGSKFTPDELIKGVSGEEISAQPFINYVNKKYGELYEF